MSTYKYVLSSGYCTIKKYVFIKCTHDLNIIDIYNVLLANKDYLTCNMQNEVGLIKVTPGFDFSLHSSLFFSNYIYFTGFPYKILYTSDWHTTLSRRKHSRFPSVWSIFFLPVSYWLQVQNKFTY